MALLACPFSTLRLLAPLRPQHSPLRIPPPLATSIPLPTSPQSTKSSPPSARNSSPNVSAVAAVSSSCSRRLGQEIFCGVSLKDSAISALSSKQVGSGFGTCGGVPSISCSAEGGFQEVPRARNRTSAIAARASKSVYPSRRVLPFRALLALSAAAAIIFLRRRRNLQQMKARGLAVFKGGQGMAPKLKRVDAHLHVWASPEEAKIFPYFPGQEPTLPGSADDLLKCMAEAGVDGAVIIQPINHKFDHSYLSSVLQKYPNKFVGMCLADPTEGGGGVKELERLVEEEDFRGVRFNPYLWPSGQKMTNDVGKAMFAKAGELGVPVGFMCFKGLMLHIDEIEELCNEFPTTTVLMDHLGFCKPPLNGEEAEAWTRLLNLSKHPQVYVKVSAFFRVSREPFPYKDTWPLLKQLLESYGADRLMWGSDYPFVAAECGYTSAWRVLPAATSAEAFFATEELEALMGGTILAVFRGGWRSANTGVNALDLDSA